MNAQKARDGLDILQTQLASILDQNSTERTLGKARTDVEISEELYYRYVSRTDHVHPVVEAGWGFAIKNPPLTFTATTLKGYPLRADIQCDFRWKGNAICTRNVVLRIWALRENMIYREGLDAEEIGDLVTLGELKERVMLRFHFDMAAEGVSELKHHLQVAGVEQPHTYCWLHPQIEVPRFPYAPVDLFLVCELVGANFYTRRYDKIRNDATWVGQIRVSQELLLEEYYSGCLKAVRDGRSVLMDHLWQR